MKQPRNYNKPSRDVHITVFTGSQLSWQLNNAVILYTLGGCTRDVFEHKLRN